MIAFLAVVMIAAADASEAERAYRAGDHAAALRHYESLLSAGGDAADVDVLYNLGNCCFRLGRYAEAIWYYRRAELRSPDDQEARFNRRLAEARLGVDADSWPGFRPLAAVRAWQIQLAALALVFEVAGLVLLLAYPARRAVRTAGAAVAALGALLCVVLVVERLKPAARPAVMLAREVELEPEDSADRAPARFLRAGETVLVLEAAAEIATVRTRLGTGRVPRRSVGIVD